MRVVLNLDVARLRLIALGDESAVLHEASEPFETFSLQPGWAEQRPEDWWDAFEAVFSATGGHVTLREVTEIEFSGALTGLVFLDGDGDVIRPAMLEGDVRASTGAGSALAWLRAHQTIAYKRVQHLLTPLSYMRYRFTGQFAIEPEDAAGTGLLDIADGRWSKDQCAEMELNIDVLPAVLGEGVELQVRSDVAETLGLAPGSFVVS